MFGYVRIFKPQLRVCEYDTYRAVYCTLCRELGREYGIASRLLLNYDYTFITMLYMALHSQSPAYTNGRCVCNPLKKCGVCAAPRDGFSLTAALTVIMAYYKISDNIADSGLFGKAGWSAVRLLTLHARNKARKRFPELDGLVADYITKQFAAEASENADVDSLAEPTAVMLSKAAAMLSDEEKDQRILADFGYYFGRWVYIIDALDDLASDVRSRNINPFVIKFELAADDIKRGSGAFTAAKDYANEALNATAARAIIAYELLDLHEFKPILDNIIYLGLGNSQRQAVEGKNSKNHNNPGKE